MPPGRSCERQVSGEGESVHRFGAGILSESDARPARLAPDFRGHPAPLNFEDSIL
ncbi:hypothetical protein GCM10023080_014240 [Streptomyces pseudoechinosporeus]